MPEHWLMLIIIQRKRTILKYFWQLVEKIKDELLRGKDVMSLDAPFLSDQGKPSMHLTKTGNQPGYYSWIRSKKV